MHTYLYTYPYTYLYMYIPTYLYMYMYILRPPSLFSHAREALPPLTYRIR